jgi:hypothetical protein
MRLKAVLVNLHYLRVYTCSAFHSPPMTETFLFFIISGSGFWDPHSILFRAIVTWLSLRVKRPERQADHSVLCSVDTKIAWSYISIPPYLVTMWCLIKYRDDLSYIYTDHSVNADWGRGSSPFFHQHVATSKLLQQFRLDSNFLSVLKICRI